MIPVDAVGCSLRTADVFPVIPPKLRNTSAVRRLCWMWILIMTFDDTLRDGSSFGKLTLHTNLLIFNFTGNV